MAVQVEELAGSPRITMNRRGGSAEREFKLPWASVNEFIAEYMPDPASGHVAYPGYSWLVVESVSVEPFDPDHPDGDDEPVNEYTAGGAHALVRYGTLTSEDGGMAPATAEDRLSGPEDAPLGDGSGPGGSQGSSGGQAVTWLTHRVSIGGEFLSFPPSTMQWESPADNPALLAPRQVRRVMDDTPINVVIPTIEHQLTWSQVPLPPWAGMRYCTGKVNDRSFCGAAPHTLLFLGAEAEREITNQGTKGWKLDLKFSEKNMGTLAAPKGWNHFMRPETGKFEPLLHKDGTPVYEPVDFRILFGYVAS